MSSNVAVVANNQRTMIGTIINILKQDNYYGLSNEIEIAKGKNRIPKSYTDVLNQAKRRLKSLHLPKT